MVAAAFWLPDGVWHQACGSRYVDAPQRVRSARFAAFFRHVFARDWDRDADARELGFYIGSQSITGPRDPRIIL